jgi:hypothetical protein
MPITQTRFQDGIFFCREEGEISAEDAQYWAEQASFYAHQSSYPIVALIDATEATYVTAAARRIFARASAIPNLHDAAVATHRARVMHNARLTVMLAVDKHTRIFDDIEKATQFAVNRARLLRDLHGSASV